MTTTYGCYRYRFYPNARQATSLERTLRLCCQLYNACLEQRRYARDLGRSTTYQMQARELPELKRISPSFKEVHSQVLQDVVRRVERTFANFFDRVERRKKGERIRVGFPRFKPMWRYRSFTYPQAANYKITDGHIVLPKIGELRTFMHRDPSGDIKTITVKRDKVGDWFLIMTTVSPEIPRKKPQTAVGVDVGLIKLVQSTDGEFVEAPKLLRKSEDKLKRAQKELSRKDLGSRNREKARIRVAKLHRKIQRQRDNLLHKISKELVKKADLLVFEDLPIVRMVKSSLAKSIYDASWAKLYLYVSYKASRAGKIAVRVDPKGTTCNCACGARVKLSLSERVFHCPKCGLTIDRDLHGAFGTLRKVGWEAAELTPVEMRPLLAESPASLIIEAGSPKR